MIVEHNGPPTMKGIQMAVQTSYPDHTSFCYYYDPTNAHTGIYTVAVWRVKKLNESI